MTAVTLDLGGVDTTVTSGVRTYHAGVSGSNAVGTVFPSLLTNLACTLLTVDTQTQGGVHTTAQWPLDAYVLPKASGNVGTLPSDVLTVTDYNPGVDTNRYDIPPANYTHSGTEMRPLDPTDGTTRRSYSLYGNANLLNITILKPCVFAVYEAQLDTANHGTDQYPHDVWIRPADNSLPHYAGTVVTLFNLNAVGVRIEWILQPGTYILSHGTSGGQTALPSTQTWINGWGYRAIPTVTQETNPCTVLGGAISSYPMLFTPDGSSLAGVGLDFGSDNTKWPTLGRVLFRNVPSPERTDPSLGQYQRDQLQRQLDAFKVQVSDDGTTWTDQAGPNSGNLLYRGYQWYGLDCTGASAHRYVRAGVLDCYSRTGGGNFVGMALNGLLFEGSRNIQPTDRPSLVKLTPSTYALQTGAAASAPVSMSSTSGASIWYTTDGRDPVVYNGNAVGSTTLYTGPITLSQTTTIKAIAGINNGSAWVYSRHATVSTFVCSDTRIGPNQRFLHDGTDPYSGLTLPAAQINLQSVSVNDFRALAPPYNHFYLYGQPGDWQNPYNTTAPGCEYGGVLVFKSDNFPSFTQIGRVTADDTSGAYTYQIRPIVKKIGSTFVMWCHDGGGIDTYTASTPEGPFVKHGLLQSGGDHSVFQQSNGDLFLIWASSGTSPIQWRKLDATGLAFDATWNGNAAMAITSTTGTPDFEAPTGVEDSGGNIYCLFSQAEYYTMAQTSNWNYISASTVLGLASATLHKAWSSQSDFASASAPEQYQPQTDGNGVCQGTGAAIPHVVSSNAPILVDAAGVLHNYRDYAYYNPSINVQTSNIFPLGVSAQPIVCADLWYRDSSAYGNWLQNGLTLMPVNLSGGTLTLPAPSGRLWDSHTYQDPITPPVLSAPSSVTSNTVVLTFTAPSGGTGTLHTQAQKSLNGTTGWSSCATADAASPVMATGLASGTLTYFRILVTDDSQSVASNVVSATTVSGKHRRPTLSGNMQELTGGVLG